MERVSFGPGARETVTCDCGAEYDAEVSTVGGFRIVSPPTCEPCKAKARGAPGVVVPATDDDILSELDAMGANVYEHAVLRRGPNAGQPGTLDNLGDSPGVWAARAFVESVLSAERWQSVDSLWIHGPTGNGKSQIQFAVLWALLKAGVPSREIVYDRGRSIVTQLQDRYTTGTVDEFSRTRGRARVWVYDDAGTEKLTPDAFRVFEDILDRRQGRASLVSSNDSREDTANRWMGQGGWERLRSRLAPFKSVAMTGADWRFVKSAEARAS